MFAHIDKCTEVARPEYICGWYHSHPGYGCWLSGIDVMTQQNYQKIQDPSVAIVIDPKRTIAAGKVEQDGAGVGRTLKGEYEREGHDKQVVRVVVNDDDEWCASMTYFY